MGRVPPRARYALAVVVAAVVVVAGSYLVITHRPVASSSGVSVLATFFPVYDFARSIGGDRVAVSLLVPPTVDVHSFEPTPLSVEAVASANVLIYSGAGLEPWIPAIVASAGNAGLTVVDSSAGIATLPVPPQFQRDNRTVDPHLWLDPVLAERQVANILAGLVAADPADRTYFEGNAQRYSAQLDGLNGEYANLTRSVETRSFVTFHEAFAYLAQEYSLTQIPIAGPFEEDPTPAEIQDVVNAVRGLGLCYVGYESLTNPAIAQSIASQTNASLIRMDPIEGLSAGDQAAGKTYLLKMHDNLDALGLALNHVGCS